MRNFTARMQAWRNAIKNECYRTPAVVLLCFLVATLALIYIQLSASYSMDQVIIANQRQLRELLVSSYLRQAERDLFWIDNRMEAAVATSDLSHLEGIDEKLAGIRLLMDSLQRDRGPVVSTDASTIINRFVGSRLTVKSTMEKALKMEGRLRDTSLLSAMEQAMPIARADSVMHALFRAREDFIGQVNQRLTKDGNEAGRYGRLLMAMILLACAGLCGVVIRKIRRHQRLISQMEIAEANALEAVKAKESFIAKMSHEIRTPLNAILGFSGMLGKCRITGERAPYVQAILTAGQNLLRIVDDILDISKIEAGHLRIVPEIFNLDHLLKGVEEIFSQRIKAKGLYFIIEADPHMPKELLGDPARLTQVLVNLIGNATKFTAQGGIILTVRATFLTAGQIEAVFIVADTGIGIQADKLNSIFERYIQAEDLTARSYGGTGLGLSIVSDLVAAQMGRISVESVMGSGSKFTMVLPYQVPAEQGGPVSPVPTPATPSCRRTRILILVIDDNEMNQALMQHLLTRWNFNFRTVLRAADGIALLQQQHFDLVLMDIQMPGMDGYTATHHIRTVQQLQVPIIAMTAHVMAGEQEKCLASGMNAYVSKPVNETLLYDLVLRYTGQRDEEKNSRSPIYVAD